MKILSDAINNVTQENLSTQAKEVEKNNPQPTFHRENSSTWTDELPKKTSPTKTDHCSEHMFSAFIANTKPNLNMSAKSGEEKDIVRLRLENRNESSSATPNVENSKGSQTLPVLELPIKENQKPHCSSTNLNANYVNDGSPKIKPERYQRQDSIKQLAQKRLKEEETKELAGEKVDPVNKKITEALTKIGDLNLRRSNRVDLPLIIDNDAKNIKQIRTEQREKINTTKQKLYDAGKKLGYDLRIFIDQKIMGYAVGATLNKKDSIGAQAFCGEHAYYMLDSLIDLGIPSENMTVVHALAKTSKDEKNAKHKEIDHAFLLYSDKEFTPEELISDHIANNEDNRYIAIDTWSTKKVTEYKGSDKKNDNANFIHHHLHEVMGEVNSRYTDPRTIIYRKAIPYSKDGAFEDNVEKFYARKDSESN
jgi:hypothetical protein